MKMLLAATPVFLLLGAASNGQRHYVIDDPASEVSAKVGFFLLASKTAGFPKVSGSATAVPGDPGAISLNVVIDALALTAPDEVTLNRLKGDKFFWVDRYPKITFTGHGLKLTDSRHGKLRGELTARGISRPVTLDVTFDQPPAELGPTQVMTLSAETTINRKDFGMTAYPLIVGKNVDVTIKARFVPQ